ncbi:MAG: transmembrane 220 family protein [Salinivenus sp.]
MLLLFAAAAVVQYNDPDPALWMTVYGIGAVCSALYAAGRLPTLLSRSVAALCLLGALYRLTEILFGPITFIDATGQAMMGLVEETREMLGFFLTAVWTGVLTWQEQRWTRPSSQEELQ